MRALLCRLLGHRWQIAHFQWEYYQCTRCKEPGWRL